MAYSSITGGEIAPEQASGKTTGRLGPSDSSDSGSDSMGEFSDDQLDSDSDRNGTGERASTELTASGAGADILPDHVVRFDADGNEITQGSGGDDDQDEATQDEQRGVGERHDESALRQEAAGAQQVEGLDDREALGDDSDIDYGDGKADRP